MSKPSSKKLQELLSQQPQLLATYAVKASKVDCNLAVGQPEMNPPEELHSDIRHLVNKPNYAGYAPAIGSIAARQCVAKHFKSLGIGNDSIEQVAITNGARSMISYVLMTLCNAGDRVLWFGPGYTYADTAKLLGLNPLMIPTRAGDFSPDLEVLQRQMGLAKNFGNLGAVIINNPVNPTGRVWSRDELTGVAQILTEYNVFVVADETYAGLVFDEAEFIPFATLEGMAERTVTVGSGSKSLRIPSYRLGFAHGPEEFIRALSGVVSNMAGCPNVFALTAAQDLYNNKKYAEEQLPALLRKRQMIIDWCLRYKLVSAPLQGAFYAFINFGPVLRQKGLADSMELAEALLERGVGVTPGEAFGENYGDWIRISYAGAEEILAKGLQRIGSYISD